MGKGPKGMPKPLMGPRNNGSLDLVDWDLLKSLTSGDTLETASRDLRRAGLLEGVQITFIRNPTRKTRVVHKGVIEVDLYLLFKSEGLFDTGCELVNY